MERKKQALGEPLLDGGASEQPAPRCVVWQLIFFVNVFFACISFSIVMPSLYLYLCTQRARANTHDRTHARAHAYTGP